MTINPAIEHLIDEIRDDKTHGASQLARQALEVLKVASMASRAKTAGEFKAEFDEIAQKLKIVRPSMAPVYNSVKRILAVVSNERVVEVSTLRNTAIAQIDSLIQSSVQAVTRIASLAADKVNDNDIILTHSYSSTVAISLKTAYEKKNFQVIATRSGAGRTGERTVWEIAYTGIPVTFIDDTAIGLFISHANKVLVGADRVCADGGLVNGIGTYLVALAAKQVNVPFYVLCETLKLDNRLKSTEVELEEKDPAELAPADTLPQEVIVKNPYFDITPPELITAIITENGLAELPSKLP
jgi:ribose 1,5-bisphosphate isomerase